VHYQNLNNNYRYTVYDKQRKSGDDKKRHKSIIKNVKDTFGTFNCHKWI